MGKLVYTLISSAYFVDESWGYGSPHEGMKRLARIAHKPRMKDQDEITIPVTWLVSPRSALIESEMLTTFHENHDDAIGYMLTWKNHSMKRHAEFLEPGKKDELQEHVEREIGLIKDILPWASINILGTGYRSNSLIEVMTRIGLRGIWGSCPFQIGTDGITDFGSPWGQWYVNPDNYKKPVKYYGKVINLEWTARDLSKAFHYGQAEAYSTDPNDVESQGKCTDTNVKYWKALLDEYLQNTRFNDLVFLHQHQEAHEMEASPVCIPFTRDRVEFTSRMLDQFLDHVVTRDLEIVDANEAIRMYHEKYKGNQPECYMLFKDIPIHQLSPAFKKAIAGKQVRPKHIWLSFNETFFKYIDRFVSNEEWILQEPPWKQSLFYYDADCMLVFDKPFNHPVWICNYTKTENRPWDDELLLSEPEIPVTKIEESPILENESNDATKISITVDSHKALPYGVAIWGDFSGCVVSSMNMVGTSRIMKDILLFTRFNVKEGINSLEITIQYRENT